MAYLDRFPSPNPTPEQFELEVKGLLDAAGYGLSNYRSEHRAGRAGVDGEYEIDIEIVFTALEVELRVLVECKRHKQAVKREVLLELYAKLLSLGAHKGIVFSTSGFQSGALEFASAHGIATIQLANGRSNFFTRSIDIAPQPSDGTHAEPMVGWLIRNGHYQLVSREHIEYLRQAIGI